MADIRVSQYSFGELAAAVTIYNYPRRVRIDENRNRLIVISFQIHCTLVALLVRGQFQKMAQHRG